MVCLLVLALFVSFLNIVASQNSYKYAVDLERAVIKPRACGSYYFQNLQDAFMYSFRGPIVSEPLRISEFCEKFSAQYNVTLNILDQNGIDRCIFRNPIANLFTTFLTALNRRSAEDRLTFYENIDVPLNISDPFLANITNFDAAGMLKFYIQVVYNNTSDQEALDAIYENIYNITQYPDAGPQYVPVITKQTTQSNIIASFSPSQLKSLFLRVYTEEQYESLASMPAVQNDILMLFLLFMALIRSETNPDLLVQWLDGQIIKLLGALGTFGMAKNQAIPLTTNLIQNGICYWGFNHVFHNGVMYRIVFSQSRENILTIKKK